MGSNPTESVTLGSFLLTGFGKVSNNGAILFLLRKGLSERNRQPVQMLPIGFVPPAPFANGISLVSVFLSVILAKKTSRGQRAKSEVAS